MNYQVVKEPGTVSSGAAPGLTVGIALHVSLTFPEFDGLSWFVTRWILEIFWKSQKGRDDIL